MLKHFPSPCISDHSISLFFQLDNQVLCKVYHDFGPEDLTLGIGKIKHILFQSNTFSTTAETKQGLFLNQAAGLPIVVL